MLITVWINSCQVCPTFSINEYKLDFNDLKRMHALTNDGARLFFSTSNDDDLIFNNNVYISTAFLLPH